MKHANEEQLILYYYGESDGAAEVDEHLAACESCRTEYQTLQRVLNTVDSLPVPERDAGYEAATWRKLSPMVGARSRWNWSSLFQPRRLMVAGAIAALVIAAFLAGRGSRTATDSQKELAGKLQPSGPVRERVLLVAVGDHLERSQMMLVELANADPRRTPGKTLDISFEQETAEDLLEANRLFRQTATFAGETTTADMLEELERVLIEIAHSPATVSPKQLNELKRQIQERGIIFKVKVFGSQLRRAEEPTASESKSEAL